MSVDLRDSCIAHWKMNDVGSSKTFVDETGNHNGAAQRAVGEISIPGQINLAFECDSVQNDYMQCPHHSDFNFGDGAVDRPFSIAGWFRKGASSVELFNKYGIGKKEWRVMVVTNRITFIVYDEANGGWRQQSYQGGALFNDYWFFVVCTFASATDVGMKIYIGDNEVQDTFTQSGSYTAMNALDFDVWFARQGLTEYPVDFDNVMVFDKVLSQDEVDHLYLNGQGTESLIANKLCMSSLNNVSEADGILTKVSC